MAATDDIGTPYRLVVDGVELEVHVDLEQPGAVHFTRLTPPAVGYGFTARISSYDPSWWTRERLETSARDFLRDCDPVTGYLED